MPEKDAVKTTCARDCYDACGILAHRKNGSILKIMGDPDHAVAKGALCGKCAIVYNGAWRDPAQRLSKPLKRTGKKGEGKFEEVSWDAALGDIAEKLLAITATGKAESVLHSHYTGTVAMIGGWYPIRFFNRLGATEVDPDTVCNKAGHAALDLVFGTSLEGFDPRTADDTTCILVWGANPSHSAPHQNKLWLREAQRKGAKIIVVDPIAHGTAKTADIHLKLKPGTDSALAFGILNWIKNNGRIDDDFVAQCVQGADELLPLVDEMPVSKAAEICGVTEDLISQVADIYSSGPALLWLGQGVQRQAFGGNVFRTLGALVSLTGNLGKPGAGFLYMNGPDGRGIDTDMLTAPELASEPCASVSHMDMAATLADKSKSAAFFNWNNNPLASSPEQGRLRAALGREDLFHVAVDLFHTDTTQFADLVLPAASFLECDDLILPYFDLTVSAQVKVTDPPGEALPNQEIFRRLSEKMGFNDAELYEQDDALIARLLAQTPYEGSFADLATVGTATLFPSPRIQFEALTFGTPSGKIEIASEQAVALGLPRVPQPFATPEPDADQVCVLSPASLWQMNSSYGNDAMIEKKLGFQTVTVHPSDAVKYGVADGDEVSLTNETGKLTVVVAVSDDVQPGVVLVPKGRWPSRTKGGGNVNVLVSGRKSDLAESTTVHSTQAALALAGD